MMRAPAHGMMDGTGEATGGALVVLWRCSGGALEVLTVGPPDSSLQAQTPEGFILSDKGQGVVCHCGSEVCFLGLESHRCEGMLPFRSCR